MGVNQDVKQNTKLEGICEGICVNVGNNKYLCKCRVPSLDGDIIIYLSFSNIRSRSNKLNNSFIIRIELNKF